MAVACTTASSNQATAIPEFRTERLAVIVIAAPPAPSQPTAAVLVVLVVVMVNLAVSIAAVA